MERKAALLSGVEEMGTNRTCRAEELTANRFGDHLQPFFVFGQVDIHSPVTSSTYVDGGHFDIHILLDDKNLL